MSATQLISDYKKYGIPVGATNIDSSWMTAYNTFQQNTDLWPDMGGFIADMHDQAVRVIFWATSMVNELHPEYKMAHAKGYLVKNSKGFARPVEWWHGPGCFLDYTNPEAVEWWHGQMDNILDLGADGFKCDGTDPYINEYILLGGAQGYNDTDITYREYADSYYGDFFEYTRAKRGDTGLIMSRPVDCLVDPVSKACWGYSPKNVVLSGWVGDDDSTYDGFRNCVAKIIYSGWMGYPSFGCDIGGYRGHYSSTEPIPEKEVFLRWAALGAFVPLMENGGNGEHRPWYVGTDPNDPDDIDEQNVDIYKKFVLQHHRLAPLLLTSGSFAQEQGISQIAPLASKPDTTLPWSRDNKPFIRPDTFAFLLADALLVQPIVYGITPEERAQYGKFAERTDKGTGIVRMDFPEGNTWLDWWAPHDSTKMHKGGDSATKIVPIDSLPVYVKRGALLPLAADPSVVPAFDESMPVLFTWFAPEPADETITAVMREPASSGPGAAVEASFGTNGVLTMSVSAHAGKGGVVVIGVTADKVSLSGDSGCSVDMDEGTSTTTITCLDMSEGMLATFTGANTAF